MLRGDLIPAEGWGLLKPLGHHFICADSYYEERPPASRQRPGPGNLTAAGCDQIHPVRVSSKISVPKTLRVRGQAGSDRVKSDVCVPVLNWKEQL